MLLTKFATPLILLYRNQSHRKHGQKDEKARIKGKNPFTRHQIFFLILAVIEIWEKARSAHSNNLSEAVCKCETLI